MAVELLMGNHAIAVGALAAGVGFVSGYPGTPSTEILEEVAKRNPGAVHVEWSVNEKTALEAAAGASYAGLRTLVTMKQVGLNVASDPLMSLSYIGVKGGMVIAVADDPGPISSQTEQDTRTFAAFGKLPVFDPATPEEAYQMISDAFELSEKYGAPVILRPTTRVCHAYASIDVPDELPAPKTAEGFVKDPKWVIFPRLSYQNHIKLEERAFTLGAELCSYSFNTVTQGPGRRGIAVGGVCSRYALEAKNALGVEFPMLRIATPYPFPEELAVSFLRELDEVLVLEELDPVIERELTYLCGKHGLSVRIIGKLSGDMPRAGEYSSYLATKAISDLLGLRLPAALELPAPPPLAARPPVLCAGCPHRASFYAVKQALKGTKAVFSGDIGCYTLGNAMPLDMVDTCLCMGAGITMAQGLHTAEPDTVNVAFVGDSTFFASGMTGLLNAVYNKNRMVLVVLDNSTTAMTGHQPHPGTGMTVMREHTVKADIEAILKALGVKTILTCDPLRLSDAIETVRKASECEEVAAVIFKSPCIAVTKPEASAVVTDKCIGCTACIRQIGCPAISMRDGKAYIEPSMCTGCTLCAQVCPVNAIEKAGV